MNLSNVNLSFDNIGSWPGPVKVGAVLVVCGLSAFGVYYFDTQSQLEELGKLAVKEQELRVSFEGKQKKAANLEEYRQQFVEMEQSFGDLLRQLPDKTQVPDLLVDVSQTGLASGLEFELFKPGNEAPKEFYAELPIDIRVIGSYMEFGSFISGLASLPRIVTIHNVKITPRNKDTGPGNRAKPLMMEALVKTYRYLEDSAGRAGQDKKIKRQ